MDVKGTAFLARKTMIEREFGAQRFAALIREASARDPIFSSAILATSKIPIEAFLRFNEIIVRDLFHGDEQSYFRFGEASAMWALGPDGPYRRLVTDRSVAEFAASAPAIYRNYFDHGEARSEMRRPTEVRLSIVGIDAPYRHVYFEYAVMGYFKRGLEMVSGMRIEMTADKAFSKGDDESVYTFTIV
jgi:hypothetical protein